MSSMNITSIANDLLQIFERTLNFLQSIGILEAYTFNHSNIFFSPAAEKYLENFIALLEEIKDVLNKLQDLQTQPKSLESNTTNPTGTLVANDLITASQLIQTAEMYVSEQLMTPQVELGELTTPQGLLNNDINEPATESSWVPPEEKDIEEEKENEIFQCSVCNKILSSKTVLKLHQSTHTGDLIFCNIFTSPTTDGCNDLTLRWASSRTQPIMTEEKKYSEDIERPSLCSSTPLSSTPLPTEGVTVVNANMLDIIEKYENDPTIALAHTISNDYLHPKHMSAGVAVIFRQKFGRPQVSDLVAENLACQKVPNGPFVYSLITKPTYNGKPTLADYNAAFHKFQEDFKLKGLKKLICSAMGCVRDLIEPQHFIRNIYEFHRATGVPVNIVSYHQKARGILWNGLSHYEFVNTLRRLIVSLQADTGISPPQDPERDDEANLSPTPPAETSSNTEAQHLSVTSGQKLFCCEHCGKLFTTNLNLSAHLTRQHNLNTELANSCKECGKLFVRKSALDTHLKSHLSIKPWACNVCSKTFTQKVTRDTHQLTHTRDYRFTCDTCGRKFPSKAKLNYHIKTHGEPQFSCHLCDKRFTTRQYLTAHYRTHDLRQPPPQAPCRLDTVSTQLVEETVNVFKCSHCGRLFPSKHSLSLHSQKHNPLNRYNLDKRKMAPRQKHGCNVCGKEFLLKASLAHHQRQQHSASGLRPRPYSCQLCHQTFTLKAKAKLHMQIHTQQMQHVCAICGKMFRRKDSLKRHLPLHSQVANSSGTVGRLTVPAYKCQQCDKAYRSRAALNFHAQTHQGKFKFQCNMCGKQFVRKCHYRGHLLTHSTDRPYKCDTCGKGFKDNKTCREHSKRVHAHAHAQPLPLVHTNGEPISAPEMVSELMTQDNEMAASQMAIQTLLAGDDATYGQTYDQFQACVQLQ